MGDYYQPSDDGGSDNEYSNKSIQANRRKAKGSSGGFQSMGLSHPVYTAIINRGYKIPTPIQRKAIPIILEKRDVVAMARTGSGKTAAFLIPLRIDPLPSRELAFQTLKFFKEMAKNTDLRACVLIGGGTLDDHFSSLAMNPDVIIATPGRLMHLIIEMNLDLRLVEYVVFDEADRLFEMGFAEQLNEIIYKLPDSRQTVLFSATLPKLLVDFAKAGLSDPALIQEKDASLLYLLNTVIPKDEQTIIFAATKHLVEYVHEFLNLAGISSTYVYGSLDQVARNMHIAKFRAGTTKILIVTDIAARGIDIPMLDNVINYDFPASSKILVHRCGRVARAGRKGRAFSMVSSEQLPFLLTSNSSSAVLSSTAPSTTTPTSPQTTPKTLSLGTLAPGTVDLDRENIVDWREEVERQSVLEKLANFRPPETIFEVGKRGVKEVDQQKSMEVRPSTISTNELPDNLFSSVITDLEPNPKKRKRDSFKDPEFYIDYEKKDNASERGFNERAGDVIVDVTGDDEETMMTKKKGNLVWDKRKKTFVRTTVGADNRKRIKTESGASVPATFKSNRFERWQRKTRVSLPRTGEEELTSIPTSSNGQPLGQRRFRHNTMTSADPNSGNFKRKQATLERLARRNGGKLPDKVAMRLEEVKTATRKEKVVSELRGVKQIAKMRKVKELRRARRGGME
ncbi:P-loop containing nucleoside triphosphate hydrolase protein [Chytridium lagenaria]|nr:P-loop containing nucleoside triphosphate hydrolase protein [Chytridium lagenaria]